MPKLIRVGKFIEVFVVTVVVFIYSLTNKHIFLNISCNKKWFLWKSQIQTNKELVDQNGIRQQECDEISIYQLVVESIAVICLL